MAISTKYRNDTYQPVAEAARKSVAGVEVQFRAPTAKTDARLWQQQFAKWRASDPFYHMLTTQRKRHTDEHWTVTVLTHQAAHAKFEVVDVATRERVDLDKFDQVLLAREEADSEFEEIDNLPDAAIFGGNQ